MNDTQIKNGIKIGLVNKSKRINALLKSYKSQRDYVFKWDELVQNEIHGIRVLKKANEVMDTLADGSKISDEIREHRIKRDTYNMHYLSQMRILNGIVEDIEELGGKVCLID